jgi:hypothetical protein
MCVYCTNYYPDNLGVEQLPGTVSLIQCSIGIHYNVELRYEPYHSVCWLRLAMTAQDSPIQPCQYVRLWYGLEGSSSGGVLKATWNNTNGLAYVTTANPGVWRYTVMGVPVLPQSGHVLQLEFENIHGNEWSGTIPVPTRPVVTADVLNIRGGPGTSAPVVGQATWGQQLAVFPGDWYQQQNGFVRLADPYHPKWVSSQYVSLG